MSLLKIFFKTIQVALIAGAFAACGGGGTDLAVISVSPEDAGVEIDPTTSLVLTFNDAVDPALLTATSVVVSGGAGAYEGTIVWDDVALTATFTPKTRFILTDTVTVTLPADGTGLPIGAEYTASFTVREGAWGQPRLVEFENFGAVTAQWFLKEAPNGDVGLIYHVPGGAGLGDVHYVRWDQAINQFDLPLLVSTPTVVSYNPNLTFTPDGTPHVVWDEDNGTVNFSQYASYLDSATGAFTAPFLLENLATSPTERTVIEADAAGNMITAYAGFDGTNYNLYASRYDAATAAWETPQIMISNGLAINIGSTRLEVAPDGSALVVWSESDGAIEQIYGRFYDLTTDTWEAPQALSSLASSAVFPNLARSKDGAYAVVFKNGPNPFNVYVNVYNPTTQSWLGAHKLSSGDAHISYVSDGIAFAPDGKLHVVYGDFISAQYSTVHAVLDPATNQWTQTNHNTAPLIRLYPSIELDPLGNGMVTSQNLMGAQASVQGARFMGATSTIGTFELLEFNDSGTVLYPRLVVTKDGRAVTVWTQVVNGLPASLYANVFE